MTKNEKTARDESTGKEQTEKAARPTESRTTKQEGNGNGIFKKIMPLQQERHGQLKLKPNNSFTFAAGTHVAGVMANEFFQLASTYPIVFVEEPKQDEFRPVALLGLEPGQNLFVDGNGKWEAAYIPAIVRRYPFVLARTNEEGRYTVCIDEESGFFSEEDGRPLFTDDGQPAEVLERVKRYLSGLQQMEQLTKEFCHTLKEHNLFAPLNMRVRKADAVQNITGAYAVNEQRLEALKDETFLDLRKQKMLPMAYSHLISLAQIERLLQLRDQKTPQPMAMEEEVQSATMH